MKRLHQKYKRDYMKLGYWQKNLLLGLGIPVTQIAKACYMKSEGHWQMFLFLLRLLQLLTASFVYRVMELNLLNWILLQIQLWPFINSKLFTLDSVFMIKHSILCLLIHLFSLQSFQFMKIYKKIFVFFPCVTTLCGCSMFDNIV